MRIWIPRGKIIEPRDPVIVRAGVRGRFVKLAAIRPDGRVRAEIGPFDNLILDTGLDRMGTSATTHSTVVVGTGSATPSPGDTTLANFLASSTSIESTNRSTNPSSPYEVQKTWTYRFAQGAAEGILTEVGVGWGATSLFSRELIRDFEGNPTTFTVLSDEFLDVTYQLLMFPPLSDGEGAVEIGGVPHDVVVRAANAGSGAGWQFGSTAGQSWGATLNTNVGRHIVYSGAIGAITGEPAGTAGGSSDRSAFPYTSGSFQRDNEGNFGLGDGNVGGIRSVRSDWVPTGQSGGDRPVVQFQFEYDPVIDKDDQKVMALRYRIAWDRAEP